MRNNGKKRLASFSLLVSFCIICMTASANVLTNTDNPAVFNHSVAKESTKDQAAVVTAGDEAATAAAAAAGAGEEASSGTTDTFSESPVYSKDPLQKFNRAMFTFNDKLDTFLMKPIAALYNAVMPKPLNQGIHNFFNNIGELPIIANDILQFNFFQMTSDAWRLIINSTLGVGGLIDIASRMGLPYYANDFGLTLARWGYTDSTYLVLPFFGPNTFRDGIGLPVDYYGFSVYPRIHPTSTRYELYGLSIVDRRAQLLQFQPVFDEVAIDKYVFTRNAYMQRRAFQIEQNKHLSYVDKKKTQTND